MTSLEIVQKYANDLKNLAVSRDKVIKRQRHQLKILNRYITNDKKILEIWEENKNLKKQIAEKSEQCRDLELTTIKWKQAFRCAEKSYKELKERISNDV